MRQNVSKCTKYSRCHLVLIYLDRNMTISYYNLHCIKTHQINRNGARDGHNGRQRPSRRRVSFLNALGNFDATWFYFIRTTTQSLDVIIVFDHKAILPQTQAVSNTTPSNLATGPPAVDRGAHVGSMKTSFDPFGRKLSLYEGCGRHGRYCLSKEQHIIRSRKVGGGYVGRRRQVSGIALCLINTLRSLGSPIFLLSPSNTEALSSP